MQQPRYSWRRGPIPRSCSCLTTDAPLAPQTGRPPCREALTQQSSCDQFGAERAAIGQPIGRWPYDTIFPRMSRDVLRPGALVTLACCLRQACSAGAGFLSIEFLKCVLLPCVRSIPPCVDFVGGLSSHVQRRMVPLHHGLACHSCLPTSLQRRAGPGRWQCEVGSHRGC